MTEKQLAKLEAEKKRMYEMFSFEREHSDCEYICGIDEVGRGPFAGPVVACAVILPKDCDILYLNDSKKLSEKKREELFVEIKEKAIAYGIGIVSEKVIDDINILQATYEAMRQAINNLSLNQISNLIEANGYIYIIKLVDTVKCDDNIFSFEQLPDNLKENLKLYIYIFSNSCILYMQLLFYGYIVIL